jgi:hypothetical protein
MLSYLVLYVLAAILVFQGVQLLGELSSPLGVVPPEVKPAGGSAARWGGFLVTFGVAMALAALLSHMIARFQGALEPLRVGALAIEGLFGLWLVFGRKVDYTPVPVTDGGAHAQGH